MFKKLNIDIFKTILNTYFYLYFILHIVQKVPTMKTTYARKAVF